MYSIVIQFYKPRLIDFLGFWAWFPVGPAGLRACLLFMSMLCVFMLRISQMHMGSRISPSPFDSAKRFVIPFVTNASITHTINTLFWYTTSAWWFSEVYIWSVEGANLGWVNVIKSVFDTFSGREEMLIKPSKRDYELNERPIYLRAFLITVALVQAFRHLYYDYDGLRIPVSRSRSHSSDQSTHPIDPIADQFKSETKIRKIILLGASKVALLTAGTFPFIYPLIFRSFFWSWHLMFAKIMFRISRSSEHPTTYPPANPYMIFRTAVVGFMLLASWEIASLLFTAFLVQEPLKKGQPISTITRDPNGTLLSGLKAKKEVVKTFAFWELMIISHRFPDRRKAIFSDIDRAGAPTWSQMLEAGLDVIRSIQYRIDPSSAPNTTKDPSTWEKEREENLPLPRITPKRAASPNVFATPTKKTAYQDILDAAVRKGLGSSQPWTPERTAKVKTAVISAIERSHIHPKEQIGAIMSLLLSSPLGWIFRPRPLRFIQSLVLGSPNASTSIIVDAVESIKRMSVASLSEDTYGKVQGTIPEVIRTFTYAIQAIEGFISIVASEEGEKAFVDDDPERLQELLAVDESLRAALRELLDAFSQFLQHAGLDEEEIGIARVWAADVRSTKAGRDDWRNRAEKVREKQERRQQQIEEATPDGGEKLEDRDRVEMAQVSGGL